jgi:predicted transposase YbfD/YdcC
VLTLSVLAKLAGEDEPEGMAEWVKLRGEVLRQDLGLTRATMPHAVTYRRVLGNAIEVEEFERVMSEFFQACGGQTELLAMDGKSMRGTIERGQTRGVYLLAVYAPDSGLVLNQINIEQKANEISAVPNVLSGLDLHDKVITGDALFTQRQLSASIVEAGGDYVWIVKDNQPRLRANIERLFGPDRPLPASAPLKTDFQSATTTTKAHGRLETRTLTTSALLNATTDWPMLGQVFQLVREVRVLSTGQTTREVVYGLTSLTTSRPSPADILTFRRQHWAIENRLHYCRDVIFHEDACRLTVGHAAQAIAILNNVTLGLLRVHGFSAITSARRLFNAFPVYALSFILGTLP